MRNKLDASLYSKMPTQDGIPRLKGEAEVIGLRDKITRKNTVFLVLCDMLQPVNLFCKYLQGSSLDFSKVTTKLKELTDNLEMLTERFRASLQTPQEGLYISQMATLFNEIDDRTVFTRRFRDRDVYTPTQLVEELAIPILHKLMEELDYGFNFMSAELKAFLVFSMKYLPTTIEDLGDYGKAKIETLTSYYGHQKEDTYKGHRSQSPPLFNKATAIAEFEGLKYTMFMSRTRDPDVDLLEKMLEDEHLRTTYPSMFKLILLSRLIPTSTASVERVFSLMNSLCTTNRNPNLPGTWYFPQKATTKNAGPKHIADQTRRLRSTTCLGLTERSL